MSTVPDSAAPSTLTPFSEQIRTATFADHEEAAGSVTMTRLLDRLLPREVYVSMIAQHWYTYAALEHAADQLADHPVAGAFVFESLRRTPALEADLTHLLGENWRDQISAIPATQRYVARLEEVAASQPERFVAHHYTRYMGDLSGGLMIGRIARNTYDLAPGAGADFYDFPLIEDIAGFKRDYRARLDAAEWNEEQRQNLLEEVALAYELNIDVFADLDELHSLGEG